MIYDPAIDEIRRVRHEIAEEFDNDVESMIEYFQKMDKQFAERLYKPPKVTTNNDLSFAESSIPQPQILQNE
jgi:hypothetical protein